MGQEILQSHVSYHKIVTHHRDEDEPSLFVAIEGEDLVADEEDVGVGGGEEGKEVGLNP